MAKEIKNKEEKKTTSKKTKTEAKKTTTKKVNKTVAKPKKIEKKEPKKKEIKKSETVIKEEIKSKPKENLSKKINNKLIYIIIIFVFLLICLFGFQFIKKVTPNKERELTKLMEKMGSEFYTDFYYDSLSKLKKGKELEKTLSKFKDIGIKVNLDNLGRYDNEKNAEIVSKFKVNEKECDKLNTRVTIKPKSPYGKKDFDISVELDCDFE